MDNSMMPMPQSYYSVQFADADNGSRSAVVVLFLVVDPVTEIPLGSERMKCTDLILLRSSSDATISMEYR